MYRASDGQAASEPATILLHVIAGAAPVAIQDSISATEDQSIGITLRGSDSDSDDTSIDFTVTATPQHGTLIGAPPNLSYLPAQDYNGDDELMFVASDGPSTRGGGTLRGPADAPIPYARSTQRTTSHVI